MILKHFKHGRVVEVLPNKDVVNLDLHIVMVLGIFFPFPLGLDFKGGEVGRLSETPVM